MRIIYLVLFLSFSQGYSQVSFDSNRLKERAKINFGYYANVYPDTFYVQNIQIDTLDLYSEVKVTDSVFWKTERFFYFKKDSSAFNGKIIQQNFETNYFENNLLIRFYSLSTSSYENGRIIHSSVKKYRKISKTFSPDTETKTHELFAFETHGYHLFSIEGGGYRLQYTPKGKMSNISYNHHSDTSSYSLYKEFSYHENEQVDTYHFIEVKDDIHYENQLKLNDSGDTIYSECWIDYRRNGLSIEPIQLDTSELILRTKWKNDTLLDVLTSSILFTDNKNQLISEKEFCSLLYHDINTSYWVSRFIPVHISSLYDLNYTLILSTTKQKDGHLYLINGKNKTDDEVLIDFLEKNKKRLERLKNN